MEIEILDEILEYLLFVENAKKPYNVGINKRDHYFDKYENSFLKLALTKLIKDEYLRLGTNVRLEMISRSQFVSLCHITFNGFVFIKSGGYHSALLEAQRKENVYADLQNEQRRQSASLVVLNRWIVFGAIVVAIDSTLNILNYFGVSYCFWKTLF